MTNEVITFITRLYYDLMSSINECPVLSHLLTWCFHRQSLFLAGCNLLTATSILRVLCFYSPSYKRLQASNIHTSTTFLQRCAHNNSTPSP